MNATDVVVCSFYTADDFYRTHAESLRRNLDQLGVDHRVEEVVKADGEDWADICRKKIAFLNRVCEENPTRRVFWIDVDCKLTALPDFVKDFSADIIGFQRGFGSPMTIGYGRRTRFWEPCFFGINATPGARKFMSDAAQLEQTFLNKATDDYFFEESWRANCAELSFQVIPSACVVRGEGQTSRGVPAFFVFGASGNVAEFKGKVVQHEHVSTGGGRSTKVRLRTFALREAKRVERALPTSAARRLRRISDTVGVTGALVTTQDASTPSRESAVRRLLRASHLGNVAKYEAAVAELQSDGMLTNREQAAMEAAAAFMHYADRSGEPIPLIWWARPFPGNFGDWLSPLVIAHHTERPITFQPPTAVANKSHLVSVGSIGRFIKPSSIVVGTGISTADVELTKAARYVSVRGPITAEVLAESGGPQVTSFGDPGVLLRRVLPVERGDTNGRIALVRHTTHLAIAVTLPDDIDELSVLMSHPDHIATFVRDLAKYDGVITSAMHVMIACHSYGIPCTLVTFEGFETTVHGSGIKYEDYSRGADLSQVYNPVPVSSDLRTVDVRGMLVEERVSEAKLDEVAQAISRAIALHSEDDSLVGLS